MWEQILGQSESIDYLRRSAASRRLAHALLFVGAAGIGKELVARTLAMCLLCGRVPESELEACGDCQSCRMMLAGTHPDFLAIGCPEGKSELPVELLVGSRENRGREGLCHDLSLRPMVARRRVAVIADAERMNTESANALLKTLEEPPSYAVIVLIASDAAGLLPTIRSRCQTIRFAPLSTADVARRISELEWAESDAEAQAAAALSGGSLVVAQQLLNPELRSVRAELLKALAAPSFDAFKSGQASLAALDKLGGETQQQRTHAHWIVRFLVDFLKTALREWSRQSQVTSGGPAGVVSSQAIASMPEAYAFVEQFPATAETAEMIGKAIDRCIEAENQLDGNVSVPLCLESLFSHLRTIFDTVGPRLL
jgi:DNA polymerase-3 subunit delta'